MDREAIEPTRDQSSIREGSPSLRGCSVFQRLDWLSFLAATAIALTVYLITLAPDVTLGFSGIFSTSALYAGVAHPPGYPLSTLYSWAFTHAFPVSNIAWRVAVSSAVAGAVACGLIALMVSRLGAIVGESAQANPRLGPLEQKWLRVVCGCVSGTVFGFNSSFWSRAVIADVWTLSVLLYCVVICLLMRWSLSAAPRAAPLSVFFVYGLTLTNSQIMLAAAPAIPFLIAVRNRNLGRDLLLAGGIVSVFGLAGAFPELLPPLTSWNPVGNSKLILFILVGIVTTSSGIGLAVVTKGLFSEWKSVIACGIMLLLGLTPYVWLPITSMTNPPMNWGYPRTVAGFFHVISRGQYERLHPTDSIESFVQQIGAYLVITGETYGWFCLVAALIPVVCLRKMSAWERRWLLSMLTLFAALTLLLVAVLNPGVDRQSLELSRVFFTSSYVVLALWTGHGLLLLGHKLVGPRSKDS